MYCLNPGQYWLSNIFSGFPLLIDGFVVHNATAILIVVMTFTNGLWVEDSALIALGTEEQTAPRRM